MGQNKIRVQIKGATKGLFRLFKIMLLNQNHSPQVMTSRVEFVNGKGFITGHPCFEKIPRIGIKPGHQRMSLEIPRILLQERRQDLFASQVTAQTEKLQGGFIMEFLRLFLPGCQEPVCRRRWLMALGFQLRLVVLKAG